MSPDRRAPDRRQPADPWLGPITQRVAEHLPGITKSLAWGMGLLLATLGVQIIWPGTRIANLEAASRSSVQANTVTNSRIDSVATVLRGHLTDESVTRRATQVWLCLHSEPSEQDMLQLPCPNLIQNAIRSRLQGGRIR